MINGLVVVLFIIVLLLVLTVVEQADTIKRLFLHDVNLINAINKRVNLPALSVEDVENINFLLNELNSGIGFLELSGHIKTDKAKIELLKRTLNHYIVKSPNKDSDHEQQYILLTEAIQDIMGELTGVDDWNVTGVQTCALPIFHKMTCTALKEIRTMQGITKPIRRKDNRKEDE